MANYGQVRTTAYYGRYLALNWSTTAVSAVNNYSTIKWTLYARSGNYNEISAGNFKVVIDGEVVYQSADRITTTRDMLIASGTKDISHNADGTKSFSASVEAGIYEYAVNCSGSGTFELDTITRAANITSYTEKLTDEENIVVNYTNPSGNLVNNLKLYLTFGNINYDIVAVRDLNKTGTSYTLVLTDEEKQVLYSFMTRVTGKSASIILATTIGEVTYQVEKWVSFTIVNAQPVINPTIVAADYTTTFLTGRDDVFIKYETSALVTTNATAVKGAYLTSQKVTNGGKSLVDTNSGTISGVESDTFTFTATDTRGKTTKVTKKVEFIDYIPVTCNQEVDIKLSGETAAEITLTIYGNYYNGSFGGSNNYLNLEVRHTQNDGSMGDWVMLTDGLIPTFEGNTYKLTTTISGAEYSRGYTFQSRASDAIRAVTSGEYTAKLQPVFDWSNTDFSFNVPVTIQGGKVYGAYILSDTTTADTVTLSDSLANYDYVEILFTDNNGVGGGCVKLYDIEPGVAKTINLSLAEASSATKTYLRRTAYICKDTTLTPVLESAGYVYFYGDSAQLHSAGSNYIKVTKVIGYK